MKNYLDEYSMRQASIFELRTLARDMGVNSPTTYKKEQLIDKILKIASGEEKPQMPKSRQGRPPKKAMHSFVEEPATNNLLKSLETSENCKLSEISLTKHDFDNMQFNSSWVLACPNTFEYDNAKDNTSFCYETRQGYLQIMKDGAGFIFQTGRCANADTAVFIANKTIVDNNLRNGDLIECVCKKILSNDTRYLTEIIQVNNLEFKEYLKLNRLNFEEIELQSNNKNNLFKIVDSDSFFKNINDIKQGSRNILKCKNLREYTNIVKDLKRQNKGCVVVNICLEVLPEEESLLKNEPNFESFYTLFGDSEKQNNLTVALAIERVKRLTEQNKSVIVLVNELGKLVKYQNFSLGFESFDIKYKSLDSVYKTLTLARNLKEQSITILCLFKDFVFGENLAKIEAELDNLNCNFFEI